MKPFRFPLESLRVLRKQKERAAQGRYARALAACERAEAQLQKADADLAACRELFTRELAGGTAAARLVSTRTWCLVLEIRWNERKAGVEEARRLAGIAFQEMIAAGRDREALDRLCNKSRTAHANETRREEQKQFDEFAVQLNDSPGPLQMKLN